MAQYFIKILGHQEMGSRKSRDDNPNRGRYILIGKQFVSLFPYLSETNLNDCAMICIKPLFGAKRKIYSSYIYHNSKISQQQTNGRNEYRIYISNELDDSQFYTRDLIVMRRDETVSKPLQYNDEYSYSSIAEELNNYEYFLYWCMDGIKDFIRDEINQYIETHRINANAKMFVTEPNTYFPSFENLVSLYNQPQQTTHIIVDNKTQKLILDNRKESPVSNQYSKFFNANSFRDIVLATYDNKCAVTNTAISYDDFSNVQAAHIVPKASAGSFFPSNGIALRADIHWAFDMGMFTILPPKYLHNKTDQYIVFVHPDLPQCYLNQYNGKPIYLSSQSSKLFEPDVNSLMYRYKNIFGTFKTRR